ncbi:hypothetical protein B0T22DRAFT_519075 [Podospora appendiculata]|uniref:Uncharacterized protein n=1 Tax=Podospora appendiculata TaxID=314037 RepID=A0AAE1C8R3_9PEZI|nr:hypothetical protein B0T22DRAFT_519075 [Podospora appendiculata]
MEVTSTFWYLKNLPLYQTTKPYVISLPQSTLPPSIRRTNQECVAYPGIKVRDIRTSGQTFTLDSNGFELSTSIPLGLEYEEFRDQGKLQDTYCENVKTALVDMTGAESALVIHGAIRRRHASFPEHPRGSTEAETDQPVQGVHGDFTPRQVYEYLRAKFGDERANESWNERRVQIIQVWRPLRGPVVDWPLGVCDFNSVTRESDLVATDNILATGVMETYNAFHNPKHAWYFVRNQTSEDVLLFKGFDNAKGVATCQ